MNKLEWEKTTELKDIHGLEITAQYDGTELKELVFEVEGGQIFKVTPTQYGGGMILYVPKRQMVTIYELLSDELDALPIAAVRAFTDEKEALKAKKAFEKLNIFDIRIDEKQVEKE